MVLVTHASAPPVMQSNPPRYPRSRCRLAFRKSRGDRVSWDTAVVIIKRVVFRTDRDGDHRRKLAREICSCRVVS